MRRRRPVVLGGRRASVDVRWRCRRRWWPLEFCRSAVGKKWIMAVTGIMLMGFVAFHLFGNLKSYLGAQEAFDYGEGLRDALVPILPRTFTLWLVRLPLIAAFALHM